MAVSESISVEEYLSTVYKPDCDYLEGVLEDRNVGEVSHGLLQAALAGYFRERRNELGIEVISECRIQVAPARYRVADLCVTIGRPEGRILTRPPFLCIEILSPEDWMPRVHNVIADSLQMGVPFVWAIDPVKRTATIHTNKEILPVNDGILRTWNPDFAVPLADLFD